MIYMNIIKHPHILFSFEYFCGSSPGRPIRWHCNDVTKATVTHMIRNNILLSQLHSTSLSLQQCPTIHIPVSLPQQLYVGEGSLCIQTHSFWNPSFLPFLGGGISIKSPRVCWVGPFSHTIYAFAQDLFQKQQTCLVLPMNSRRAWLPSRASLVVFGLRINSLTKTFIPGSSFDQVLIPGLRIHLHGLGSSTWTQTQP